MPRKPRGAYRRREPRRVVGPAIHDLKCWPDPFNAVLSGEKTHEWRKNDRGFKIGDEIVLREFEPWPESPGCGLYTGRRLLCRITYISDAPKFEIPKGFCVFSTKLIGEL